MKRHGPVIIVVLAAALGGCVRVRPMQRQKLASPAMTYTLTEPGIGGEYRSKVAESKTGGGVPGNAPGGGCGCTQ